MLNFWGLALLALAFIGLDRLKFGSELLDQAAGDAFPLLFLVLQIRIFLFHL